MSGGEREGHGRPGIRGNHMKLGSPATAGSIKMDWGPFLGAPVPSGCTLMMVMSIDTTSSSDRLQSWSAVEDIHSNLGLRDQGGLFEQAAQRPVGQFCA